MRALLIFLITMLFTASASADVYQDYKNNLYLQQTTGFEINKMLADRFGFSLSYSRNFGDFELGIAGGILALMPSISLLGEWHFWGNDRVKLNLGGKVFYSVIVGGGTPYLSTRLFFGRWYMSLSIEYPFTFIAFFRDRFSKNLFPSAFQYAVLAIGTGFYF